MVESAWCRGGGQAAHIESVEYVLNPELHQRWIKCKAEYDERYGASRHTILFAFHGTSRERRATAAASRSRRWARRPTGLLAPASTSSTSWLGGYAATAELQALLGKPYNRRARRRTVGRAEARLRPPPTPGGEVVIFDERAMLPLYVVSSSTQSIAFMAAPSSDSARGEGGAEGHRGRRVLLRWQRRGRGAAGAAPGRCGAPRRAAAGRPCVPAHMGGIIPFRHGPHAHAARQGGGRGAQWRAEAMEGQPRRWQRSGRSASAATRPPRSI